MQSSTIPQQEVLILSPNDLIPRSKTKNPLDLMASDFLPEVKSPFRMVGLVLFRTGKNSVILKSRFI